MPSTSLVWMTTVAVQEWTGCLCTGSWLRYPRQYLCTLSGRGKVSEGYR